MTPVDETPCVATLFAFLIAEFRLLNASHLAAEMDMTSSTMSKLMNAKERLSAKQILYIHEYFGVDVWKIRELSGQHDWHAKRKAGLQAGSVKRNTEDAMIAHKNTGGTP